jgi:ribosomal protein L9
MPYVERREGVVVGLYANAQPGYAEEWLDSDNEGVVACQNLISEAVQKKQVTKQEAADMAKSGDYEAAFNKVLELL